MLKDTFTQATCHSCVKGPGAVTHDVDVVVAFVEWHGQFRIRSLPEQYRGADTNRKRHGIRQQIGRCKRMHRSFGCRLRMT
jgi:hypothetical protein